MIESIDRVVNAIGGFLYRPYIVPLFLLAAGLYFTIRTGLIQFRLFGESIRVVKEKPKEKGSISSFGALMVSTASRVGTGNIVGVSTAICLGGFGAVFWMWVVALVGGASAFIESALAQVYKKRDADGSSYGGPSYYMEQALHQRWLGIVFAVVLILTYVVGFNMLAAYNLQDAFGGFSFYVKGRTPYIIGAILAVLFAVCVLGGGKRLTDVTGVLVPVMGLLYIVMSLVVVFMNIRIFPSVIANIFRDAFNFKAAFSGFTGSCIMWGIKRGLYSNEAGMGSAPNAAATADVSHPAKQGLVQMLSVFIDTLLICSATAFMCLCSGRCRLCAGVRAAVARQLRPDLHRHLHVPVRVHDAHRQLLLLRGLPEVHPQARPEQGGHDGVPCTCVSDRVRRCNGQRRSRVGYGRYAPGHDGHHQRPRHPDPRQQGRCCAQGLYAPAQRGQGSAVPRCRHRHHRNGFLELSRIL